MAIDCSGRKCFALNKVTGTTIETFESFIRSILTSPAPVAGPQRTLLWDNLATHHAAQVVNAVFAAGHLCLGRPPYLPEDGPIEFAFNDLQCALTHRLGEIHDDNSFVQTLTSIVANMGAGFDATFVHCGYQ